MAARDGNEMLVSTFFSVRSRQGGGGHEKAYVLYARVYVENYARPLTTNIRQLLLDYQYRLQYR